MTKQIAVIPAQAVFDQRLGNADLRVLNALATFADRSGQCWPATTTLASKLCISDRRIRSCLRVLESLGYVQTEHRAGQRSVYTIIQTPVDPGTSPSGVSPDPGTLPSGESGTLPSGVGVGIAPNPGTSPSAPPERELPGTPEREVPPKEDTTNTTTNYAFAGKVVRLKFPDFNRWKEAYPNLDLRAELQALDDYYDTHLTGTDRKKWFARCSGALAKMNARARSDRQDQTGETRFNDGVCD